MFEYFKGNYAWNLALVTLVEDVGTISEPMEASQSVAHLADAPPAVATEAWYQAMAKLGEKLERLANDDLAAGHKFTAARKFFRSSMYFMRAERMMSHSDSRRLTVYKRSLANYRNYVENNGEDVELLQIPYEGAALPAIFIPAHRKGPAPIVVHIQGFDSVKETQYPILGEYRRRGISCLIVDQPGAGEALRLQNLYGTLESERYVAKVIDWIIAREDIATDQIGLAGISMGGYYAPRAAAFEPRVKALATWGALFAAPRNTSPMANSNPSVPSPLNHGAWAYNKSSAAEFGETLAQMSLEGVIEKITCPLLVIHGENDRQVALQQAINTFEKATMPDKTLRIFSLEEGGSEHCQIVNRTRAVDCMADWFADKFKTI